MLERRTERGHCDLHERIYVIPLHLEADSAENRKGAICLLIDLAGGEYQAAVRLWNEPVNLGLELMSKRPRYTVSAN